MNSKKSSPALLFLLFLVLTLPAHAQLTGSTLQIQDTVTFGLAPDAGSLEWRDNGILISKGVSSQGTLLPGDQGAGTRLLWYPGKAAFRVGSAYGNAWDDANIGVASIAMGSGAMASGWGTVALGTGIATGSGSFCYGGGMPNSATGTQSVSLAGGLNTASGEMAVTIGGMANQSSGGNSFATGQGNIASGFAASVFGSGNRAESANSFVIGRYNIGGFAPTGNTTWIATDPLLEVGNGASFATRSNALTVYKNGNATFQGVVRVAPGGDIPMYSGN